MRAPAGDRRCALPVAPALGLAFALASQGMFWSGNPDLALGRWILFVWMAPMSLLLSCAVRMLFPPATQQLHGANAPAGLAKAEQRVRAATLRHCRQSPAGGFCCYW